MIQFAQIRVKGRLLTKISWPNYLKKPRNRSESRDKNHQLSLRESLHAIRSKLRSFKLDLLKVKRMTNNARCREIYSSDKKVGFFTKLVIHHFAARIKSPAPSQVANDFKLFSCCIYSFCTFHLFVYCTYLIYISCQLS